MAELDVTRIISSLVYDYNKRVESGVQQMMLPDTEQDKKCSPDVEGRIGLVLVELMAERFRRFHDSLMVFNGSRWELIDPEQIALVVAGFFKVMKVAPCYQVRSVGHICKMVLRSPDMGNFEPSRSILFFRNTALVLGRGGDMQLMEKSPKLMTNIYLDFAYNEFATCEGWEKFLSIVLDDGDAIKVIQEFLGCMLIDKEELSIEKALFCYGTGSNGKSVIFETLQAMLGDNLTNVGIENVNNKNGGDYFTASLVGKLLAYNSDAEAKDIGSGKFKQLISKEKIAVRPIRQMPFESDDWPMFMANINRGLITTDSSDGFWRRNIVIWFNKVFSDNPDPRMGQLKADRSFKGTLKSEIPGIFNWVLVGRQRIIKQRGVFTKSKSIDEITEDMRNSSTGVYGFLADYCYSPSDSSGKGELRKMLSKDIYKQYCDWCLENGYRDPKHIGGFKNDMINSKFTWVKCMKVDGMVSSGYILYKLPKEVKIEIDAGEEDMDLWGEDDGDYPG